MKFKVGDKVLIIAGKDKGKEGKILKTFKKENKVIVEGLNIVKKSTKPDGVNSGGIVEKEAKIDASNVMHIDPKTKKRTRISYVVEDGKKVRITKKSKEKI